MYMLISILTGLVIINTIMYFKRIAEKESNAVDIIESKEEIIPIDINVGDKIVVQLKKEYPYWEASIIGISKDRTLIKLANMMDTGAYYVNALQNNFKWFNYKDIKIKQITR